MGEPTLNDLVAKIKGRADFSKAGMIACHNGVVRGSSRSGQPVQYLDIDVDAKRWETILHELRAEPGILAIEAHLLTGRRFVGQDVMFIVVAGDVRENVLSVLGKAINRLKAEAVKKRETLL
jgi:molybdopterin synthase catalytic subunit